MPANLENPAMATALGKSVSIRISKKGNVKECSNYCTIALISHTSKVMLKILQATWTVNFLMFKLVLEKAEEPEIKLPTSTGSWKKQESSRKTSISALLTMPKPLTVWITHSLVCFKCYLCASIFSLAFILVPWESILNTVAWMILLKYVRLYHCFNQKSSLTSYVT